MTVVRAFLPSMGETTTMGRCRPDRATTVRDPERATQSTAEPVVRFSLMLLRKIFRKSIKESVDAMSFTETTPEEVCNIVRKIALCQAGAEFGDSIEVEFVNRPVSTRSEIGALGQDAKINSLMIKRAGRDRTIMMVLPSPGDRYDFLISQWVSRGKRAGCSRYSPPPKRGDAGRAG